MPEVAGCLDRVTSWPDRGHSWRSTRPDEWWIYVLKYATSHFIRIAVIRRAQPFVQIFHVVHKLFVWEDMLGNLWISRRCAIINLSLSKLWILQYVTTASLVGLRTVAINVVVLVLATAVWQQSVGTAKSFDSFRNIPSVVQWLQSREVRAVYCISWHCLFSWFSPPYASHVLRGGEWIPSTAEKRSACPRSMTSSLSLGCYSWMLPGSGSAGQPNEITIVVIQTSYVRAGI